MVSEEIEFNHAMEAAGVGALESDMGEYIVQLAGEKPSTSSCRRSTRPSSRSPLFAEHIPGVDYTGQRGRPHPDRPPGAAGRSSRSPTSASPASILRWPRPAPCASSRTKATAGCAPRCPGHRHHRHREGGREAGACGAAVLHPHPLATGQAVSTYFNMISGPRKANEKDGPKENLVLLDNGRSFRPTPTNSCARRCSASAAAPEPLPGHPDRRSRLRHDLPGPIGKIVSPPT